MLNCEGSNIGKYEPQPQSVRFDALQEKKKNLHLDLELHLYMSIPIMKLTRRIFMVYNLLSTHEDPRFDPTPYFMWS